VKSKMFVQLTNTLGMVFVLSVLFLAGCNTSSPTLTPVALTIPGIVLYYPFSGNAQDMSPNHNNGQVHGATLATDRFGISNNAYYFNGVDNYISFDPSKLPLGNSPRTISAWVKVEGYPPELFPGLGSRPTIFAWGINNTDQLSEIQLVNGSLQFHTYSNINQSSSSVLELNHWYHVAAVYMDGSVSLYVNGVEEIFEASTIDTPSGTGRIGTWPDPPQEYFDSWKNLGYFQGTIDDISVYNQALTAAQIYALYSEGGWGK